MRIQWAVFLVILLMTSVILNACSLPVFNASGYTVILTDPGDGSVWTVGTDVGMQAQLSYDSSLPAVTHLTFWANGRQVSDVPPSGELYTDIHWTPSTVGEYLVQVQATMSNGRIAISSPSRVCVVDTPIPDSESNSSSGYTGPCPPPTSDLSPSSAPFSMTSNATPDSLVYQTDPPTPGCVTTPTVTIQSTLNDLGDRAEFVFVDYDAGGGGSGTLVLNPLSISPSLVRSFSGTITAVDEMLRLTAVGHGTSPTAFTWTARAYDRTGAVLATNGPNTIPVAPCNTSPTPMSRVIQPFPSATSSAKAFIANAQSYPNPIYYGDTCPNLASLSFRAALNIPPGTDPKLLQVLAHINLNGSDGSNAGNLLVPLLPNGTWDAASGGQIFLGSVSLTHSYNDANNQFNPASLGGNNGTLHWYITASLQNSNLGQSAEQTINLAPCPKYAKPTSPPGSSGNVCSGYTNPSACTSNGCSWNKLTNTCS